MSGREQSWKLGLLLGALAILLFCGKPLYGQSSAAFTATLNGRVTDPAGLAVKGAAVTLTSSENGVARTTATGDTGFIRLRSSPQAPTPLRPKPRDSSSTDNKESPWRPARPPNNKSASPSER